MTNKKGTLRKAFEEVSREDLGFLRQVLLAPNPQERDFFTKLSESRLAEVIFTTGTTGQLRYQINWTERGRLRSHTASASIASTGTGRRDLLLDDFPSTIEPLGLLEGDFDSDLFPGHQQTVRITGNDPVPLGKPLFDLDEEQLLSLSLGAASEEDEAEPLSEFGSSKEDPDFAEYALGAATEESDDSVFGLQAASEDNESWNVKMLPHVLSIEFHSTVHGKPESLPAVVRIETLGGSGNSDTQVLNRKLQLDSKRQCWTLEIPRKEIVHIDAEADASITIQPVRLGDVIAMQGVDELPRNTWSVPDYLSTHKFNAFVGRFDSGSACFFSITNVSPWQNQRIPMRIVDREIEVEAENEDAVPFDEFANRVDVMMQLVDDTIPRVVDKLELRQLGLVHWKEKTDFIRGLAFELIKKNLDDFERVYQQGHDALRAYFFTCIKRFALAQLMRESKQVGASIVSVEESELDVVDRVDHKSMYDSVLYGEIEKMLPEFLEQQQALGVFKIELRAFQLKWLKQKGHVAKVSDGSIAGILNAEFNTDFSPDNINNMLNNVWKRLRLFAVSKRVFENQEDGSALLDKAEFNRLQERIAGAKRGSSKADLKIDVSLASLKLREECHITDEDLDFIEEWMLRQQGKTRLSAIAQIQPNELERVFCRLGLMLHVRILLDHGRRFRKWPSRFVTYWLLDRFELDQAVERTMEDIRWNQEKRRRRKGPEGDDSEGSAANSGEEFNVNDLLKEIEINWNKSKTLVPPEYRQVPQALG